MKQIVEDFISRIVLFLFEDESEKKFVNFKIDFLLFKFDLHLQKYGDHSNEECEICTMIFDEIEKCYT